MDIYNHFQYGRFLAEKLKDIRHSTNSPRYFEAFGLEDLYSLDDKLSSVTGTILIAIDGHNSKSGLNDADSFSLTPQYSFIVARNAVSDYPETISEATKYSEVIVKQIMYRLLLDAATFHYSDLETHNFELNGIGPIGDNFYGIMLSFSFTNTENFHINKDFWEE